MVQFRLAPCSNCGITCRAQIVISNREGVTRLCGDCAGEYKKAAADAEAKVVADARLWVLGPDHFALDLSASQSPHANGATAARFHGGAR